MRSTNVENGGSLQINKVKKQVTVTLESSFSREGDFISFISSAVIGHRTKDKEQGHWVVLQVQEVGYESSNSFRRRVAK